MKYLHIISGHITFRCIDILLVGTALVPSCCPHLHNVPALPKVASKDSGHLSGKARAVQFCDLLACL